MPKDYRALFGRRILVAPSRQLRAFQALAGGYAMEVVLTLVVTIGYGHIVAVLMAEIGVVVLYA